MDRLYNEVKRVNLINTRELLKFHCVSGVYHIGIVYLMNI